MKALQNFQLLIERELGELNKAGNPVELYEPIRYILSLGGKRLRPILLLLSCKEFGGHVSSGLKAAAAIEVFHNFTLLHDDIMDKAPLRRSKATVHEKWNSNIAILSGDAMFVQACQLMLQVPDYALRPVLEMFYKTAIEVCEGQQMDMNFELLDNVSIKEYELMISLKTAVLVGASMYIGAMIGGSNQQDARLIYDFGKNVGVAFQLQDDILDVYGDERFGKQVGGDIASNKKTFLLLKAFELAKGEEQQSLNTWIKQGHEWDVAEKVVAVKKIYNSLNIRKLAESEMEKHYAAALAALAKTSLPEASKTVFRNIASDLMSREV